MRGVEIGQSRSGALRGNQPEEQEDGKPLLRVGTRYPSLLTQPLLTHQPAINLNPLSPVKRGGRGLELNERRSEASLRGNLWHILLEFPFFLPHCLGIPQVRWKLHLLMSDKGSEVP